MPVGTALTRIPAILPSHEAGHDPRIADEPWKRKIAWSSHPSERSVPWAGTTFRKSPKPPSYPPPSHVKSSRDYPQEASGSKDSSNKSSDYPPQPQSQPKNSKVDPNKERDNLKANRRILEELEEAGAPIMPDGWYYSAGILTSLGWVDPLEVFYDEMIPELQQVCVGQPSIGAYGSSRRLAHAEAFGTSDEARTLLRLEEHAFYVVVIKLTATVAMANPDRLSSDQRLRAGALMAFCPSALKTCLKMTKGDFDSLPSQREVEKVLAYCSKVCDLAIPLWAQQVPGPPYVMPTQGMSRKQMAALLM